jgi:hypothetical protein
MFQYFSATMSSVQAPQPLSTLQTELLKLYAVGISNDQLLDVKRLLARYFAESAMNTMDAFWEEQGLDNSDMDKWLYDEHSQGTVS